MSLLLEARRKSQLSQAGNGDSSGIELSLEDHPGTAANAASPAAPSFSAPQSAAPLSREGSSGDMARTAGQNLFSAKFSPEQAGINRSLLLALGFTALLLTAGAGYVWYISSASDQPPLHIAPAPIAAPEAAQPPTAAETAAAKISPTEIAVSKPVRAKRPARTAGKEVMAQPEQTRGGVPMRVEQHEHESIDPLLSRAYLAYREGKFDLAQQLYRDALRLDERNTDAMLGLAAIAQRRGADGTAAHYYAKVLELDPRDAVANAGMSALTTDENRESRLKILLNEQQDSSALHFALGNHYAAQERWGEAQQAYFNAFKLEPQNAALVFNLAISLDRLGQYDLAAQYYQTALQLDASRSTGFDHARISGRIDELTR